MNAEAVKARVLGTLLLLPRLGEGDASEVDDALKGFVALTVSPNAGKLRGSAVSLTTGIETDRAKVCARECGEVLDVGRDRGPGVTASGLATVAVGGGGV